MEINIVDGIFVYKLFDKRDSFPFDIVRMPNLGGNIPEHIFYGSWMAEILRIGRATLYYQDFLSRVKQLYYRMVKQGGSEKKLQHHLGKILLRYEEVLKRYNKTRQEIVDEIITVG